MNIKYSTFKSLLKHSATFEQENSAFLAQLEKALQVQLVETAVEDYDCDLKLLFVQTGGSEGLFLQNLPKLQSPFYLLTNGGNNSLAASLEILTYAKLHGFDGEILHGDCNYIAQRIAELATLDGLKKRLANVTLGVVGKPSDWLISSIPSCERLKAKLGINLRELSLQGVERDVLSCADELQKAQKVYDNLVEMVRANNLSGLTIRCFDLLSSANTTGCLALAKLNQEGIVATCEGDVMAMISMCLVKEIFNLSSFQANPSRIDTEHNRILFAHCTVPLDMVESFRFETHFESGIGIAIKGEMKTLPVTVFRMSADLENYTVLQGEIVENTNESNLCRTQIVVQCRDDVSTLLKNPWGNHHIIFYGHHKQTLQNILNVLLK